MSWLEQDADFPARGDDAWLVYAIHAACGSDFSAAEPGALELGKNAGFTDWTHPRR